MLINSNYNIGVFLIIAEKLKFAIINLAKEFHMLRKDNNNKYLNCFYEINSDEFVAGHTRCHKIFQT